MRHAEPRGIEDAIDADDIAAFDLTCAAITQKLLPVAAEHQHHDPRHCLFADQQLVAMLEDFVQCLNMLITVYNRERGQNGLPPVVRFQDGVARRGGPPDA